MNKNRTLLFLLVIASLALIGVGAYQLLADPTGQDQAVAPGPTPSIAEVPRISVRELHAKLQKPNPPQVWELRSAEAFAGGHIANSQFVAYNDIPVIAQKLDRKQPLVLLCA